jgi:hypothetical protein
MVAQPSDELGFVDQRAAANLHDTARKSVTQAIKYQPPNRRFGEGWVFLRGLSNGQELRGVYF